MLLTLLMHKSSDNKHGADRLRDKMRYEFIGGT